MKNNYLWDKTGEDAEIEQLEKTLQVFRYQELLLDQFMGGLRKTGLKIPEKTS